MAGVARILSLCLIVGAFASAVASEPEQVSAEQCAARLVAAAPDERRALLDRPEYAGEDVANALLALGETERRNAEFPRALAAFQIGKDVAARAGAERQVGLALIGAANVLYAQGEIDRAREVAEESVRFHEERNDPAGQAEAWNTIGHSHFGRTEYTDAIASYQKSLALWTAGGDRRGIGRALNNIAGVHKAVSSLDEALSEYEQALSIFNELDDRRSAAVVTDSIGLVYFNRGEYRRAVEYSKRSLAMKEALGDRYGIAKSLDSLGNIYRAKGDYARALDHLQRSLKLRQAFGDKYSILESWNNVGLVHFSQGDYGLAIDAYKRGLRLNREIGASLEAEALLNIGKAAWKLGQRQRAEANYRESLRISERTGVKGLTAEILHDLGRMALETGRTAEAEALLKRSLQLREGLKDQAGTAESLNALASARLAVRRFDDAAALARRASEIARKYEQPEALWEAHTLTGIAQRLLGQPDAARRSFMAAIDVIEGLREQVVAREIGRERFFETRLSPYHELMALAIERRSNAEALEIAEQAKARVLTDLLQRGRIDIFGAMSDEEKRDEGRLRASLLLLNQKIQTERLEETPDEQRLASLTVERQGRRSEYDAFQAAVHAKHPELGTQRAEAGRFSFTDAGALVPDPSVAVLEYVVADDRSYLFVITREDGRPTVETHSLPAGRAALATSARRFRDRIARRDLAWSEDARQLYNVLLAPARQRLEGKKLIIVAPDGPLWDVPFQALQDARGRNVIEWAAVSYTPSLTVLRETLRRPTRNAGPPALLAMGKSDFSAKGAPPAVALMSDLGPLPEAERQVRLIGMLYGPGRSATYVGAEAREDRFKAEAPRYDILHLATHGVLDESSPFYSHVVLSPGSGGSSEDGLLEAWEMLDLNLRAELVVLSACETGRGRIARGEGIVGMTWAIFVAGSRAMVVSQWKVESSSTTELMTAFHRALARGGGNKAEHLRRSSLEILHNDRYGHPFYWAPFVLVGNPF